jgi:hypothetical protein
MVKESWPGSSGGTNREIVPKERVYQPEVVSPLEGLNLGQKRQLKAALDVFKLYEGETGRGIDSNTDISQVISMTEILSPVTKLLAKIKVPISIGGIIKALENDQEIIDNRGY